MKESVKCSKTGVVTFMHHVSKTIPILLFILSFLPYAYAATFTVNDLGDASDANPGDGQALTSGGVTTLRAAIEEANALSGEDTVTFDTTLFASPQTLLINKTLSISENIIITGPGADKAILDAQSLYRIMFVDNEISVSITGLSMMNGSANSISEPAGGAVYISPSGLLDMSNCNLGLPPF